MFYSFSKNCLEIVFVNISLKYRYGDYKNSINVLIKYKHVGQLTI